MKSWKTTAASISSLLVLIGSTVKQLVDGDTSTNPDWNLVLPLFLASLVGLFSRDNDKTSEQVGIKGPQIR
jgi:hypothetical protein